MTVPRSLLTRRAERASRSPVHNYNAAKRCIQLNSLRDSISGQRVENKARFLTKAIAVDLRRALRGASKPLKIKGRFQYFFFSQRKMKNFQNFSKI